MEFQIIPVKAFLKDLKGLAKVHSSLIEDMDALAQRLKHNPEQGIGIGKNCYKIRLAISSKGKGKSGGARVITCVRVVNETVYLLAIYDKSDMVNIDAKDLQNRLMEIPE